MNLRTDLAAEAFQNGAAGVQYREFEREGIPCTEVRVGTSADAQKLGKAPGRYISFESTAMERRAAEEYGVLSRVLASLLRELLPLEAHQPVLVAGLGNRAMTPDAIGPKVVEKIVVTRHLFEFMPRQVDHRMRSVCAIAPGVFGVTGLESADVIRGICRQASLGAVIVIDALAARKRERMFSTFQLSDTGIEPGAGVGNRRSALNQKTLGIPVIAIGVPTVIEASSLVYDAAVRFLTASTGQKEEQVEQAAQNMAAETDLVVTPKEVDVIAADCAHIIAEGINLALHDGISPEELHAFAF